MGQPIVRCNHCGILTSLQPNAPYRCLVCGTSAGQAFGPDAGWLYRFLCWRMQHEQTCAVVAAFVELRERGQHLAFLPPDYDALIAQYQRDVFAEPSTPPKEQ